VLGFVFVVGGSWLIQKPFERWLPEEARAAIFAVVLLALIVIAVRVGMYLP
jgi:hypothetical protein